MTASDAVLSAEHLSKTFAVGFFRKKVRAVEDLSLEVQRGEIFGFLGPNGAGKTTTIKMLMGLIFPTSGSGHILGKPIGDVEAKRRMGFLPETPYFYDYLTAEEFLDLAGALCDQPRAIRRRRAGELLERVGLAHARNRALRKFSKGMLQRVGIAQALMHDPELVVLDEPMTGLDPIGRKEIRDFIVELRREGKTVFFSTHILSDVELICDRVAIVVGGRVRDVGPLARLLSPRLLATEVVLRGPGGEQVHTLEGDADVDAFVRDALQRGEHLVSVLPRREQLEDLFVREARAGGSDSEGARPRPSAPVRESA
jgi:ABC-2 type transport system ATP-binding protein